MTFPHGQAVTLIRRVKSGTDALGNDVWSETRTDVRGVFSPGGSTEIVQGQDLVISQPTLALPPKTVVSSVDAVEVNGDTYEIDGSPNAPISPFTAWQPGVVVRLKRVTG